MPILARIPRGVAGRVAGQPTCGDKGQQAEPRQQQECELQRAQPRVGIAAIVRDHATAAMDVSDGLAGDLAKLCKASGVSAEIKLEQVPLSSAARVGLAAELTTIEALISGAGTRLQVICPASALKSTPRRTATGP